MTNIEALRALMRPYELAEDTCQILLLQQGLEASDDYEIEIDEKALYTAVIDALWHVITLTEESDNGSKQKYDISLIKDLIKRYQKKYGIEEETAETNLSHDFTPFW